MRLICPNCGAQYEVEDGVVPDAGRDVQCSNCGHTWFQQPAHLDAELAEELGEETLPADGGPPEGTATDTVEPQRRDLDPSIANVLREEAEREAEARRADAEGLEVQADLGIDDAAEIAADRSAAARARMARLRGLEETPEDAEALAAAAALGSRSDLLPDVEEINSTLRAAEDRSDEADMAANPLTAQSRRGSRTLSRLIILAVIVAVIVYALAPKIAEYLPGAEPYLTAYVDWANSVRAQINGLISMAAEKIKGLTG